MERYSTLTGKYRKETVTKAAVFGFPMKCGKLENRLHSFISQEHCNSVGVLLNATRLSYFRRKFSCTFHSTRGNPGLVDCIVFQVSATTSSRNVDFSHSSLQMPHLFVFSIPEMEQTENNVFTFFSRTPRLVGIWKRVRYDANGSFCSKRSWPS